MIDLTKHKQKGDQLLQNIKNNLFGLEKLLEKVDDHWGMEDLIYRFYHQSFKVYNIQNYTQKIYEILEKISPHDKDEHQFNDYFQEIITAGTEKKWQLEHNKRWTIETRPLLEAFFHAKYFLEMAVKYGHKYNEIIFPIDSGWATLLELYCIR